jgi:hypothetical protein
MECAKMQNEPWPAALSPEEEVFFVSSIPQNPSLEELAFVVDAERRRRLDRQAHPKRYTQDVGFALVAVPIPR